MSASGFFYWAGVVKKEMPLFFAYLAVMCGMLLLLLISATAFNFGYEVSWWVFFLAGAALVSVCFIGAVKAFVGKNFADRTGWWRTGYEAFARLLT